MPLVLNNNKHYFHCHFLLWNVKTEAEAMPHLSENTLGLLDWERRLLSGNIVRQELWSACIAEHAYIFRFDDLQGTEVKVPHTVPNLWAGIQMKESWVGENDAHC